MIYFHNDYSEGCHERILQRLVQTNLEQTPGYGEDVYCRRAAEWRNLWLNVKYKGLH